MPIFGQNARIRPNLAVLGQKFLIFTKLVKVLYPPRQLVRTLDQMGQKCPYLAKNVSFGSNLAGGGGGGSNFLSPSYQGTNEAPFWICGAKSHFFLESRFLSTGHITKKRKKFAKRLIFILAKGICLFAQPFLVLARTFLESRRGFFCARNLLAQKSDFCHTTQNFDNGLFVTFGETIHFQPLEQFFDFSCPSYGRFRKKIGRRVKKSSPSRLWGHRNSPSALSAQALRLDSSPNDSPHLCVKCLTKFKLYVFSLFLQ